MADKIPQLGSSVKGVSEVYDMIKNPEYVRETTRPANLKRAIERGTPSTVVRSAGYNRLFQTFLKHGISSATVNKFKSIPDIADFDNAKAYSDALRKFRNTAFKGLSNKQLGVIESSGFLSQYAKDQRIKMLKSGKDFNIKNLNKALDQLFDFTFMTKKSAAGVASPKVQSKIYTQIRDMAKSTLNKAQRLNLDYALSQVDKLFKSGQLAKAGKMLAGISTMVAKGVFGKALPGVGHLITTPTGLDPSDIEPTITERMESAKTKAAELGIEPTTKLFREGGIMDINHMTRPLKGYNSGGPAGMTDLERTGYDRSKSSAWNINDLVRDVVGDIGTSIKSKVSGAGEKIKNLFEGGDDSRYMRFFDKLWKEGYSQKQIDMIWNSGGKINKEDIVPERVEYDFDKEKSFVPEGEFRGAKGGLASISQMTRPVHMAGGGDPELKGLLKALTIQLMLEKGMEGSTLMPSGNPDKIKRLEDKIQAIKIELGE